MTSERGSGGAGRDPVDHLMPEADDRRLSTIRGLLAKAEATQFPEEAEAFFDKASEMIARFAVDEAALWAASSGSREEPGEIRLVVHPPYLGQKAVLVGAVAGAQGCQAVRFGNGSAPDGEVIAVVGFPSDLRWVETLVTSLLVQLTAAMLAGCPRGLSPARSAGWRRSFIMGFADEVGSRLSGDREVAAREADLDHRPGTGANADSMAVVLVERSEEVVEEFRRRFPRIRTTRASTGGSRAGHDAGRLAGRDAALTRDAVGGRRSIGHGR